MRNARGLRTLSSLLSSSQVDAFCAFSHFGLISQHIQRRNERYLLRPLAALGSRPIVTLEPLQESPDSCVAAPPPLSSRTRVRCGKSAGGGALLSASS